MEPELCQAMPVGQQKQKIHQPLIVRLRKEALKHRDGALEIKAIASACLLHWAPSTPFIPAGGPQNPELQAASFLSNFWKTCGLYPARKSAPLYTWLWESQMIAMGQLAKAGPFIQFRGGISTRGLKQTQQMDKKRPPSAQLYLMHEVNHKGGKHVEAMWGKLFGKRILA